MHSARYFEQAVVARQEIHASDGRRQIRVYYSLQGYVEFFELLVSAMTLVEERAA